MLLNEEEIRITILIGTFLVFFFAIALALFFSLFNKKNQLHHKEKQIIQANFNQTLLQSQLEIQEQTFNTISREIHDNVGQILSLTKVQLNIIEHGDTINKPLLIEAKENISKALTDLRDIAKGLSSDHISILGLIKSVDLESQRINRSGFLKLRFQVNGKEQFIDQQKQLILFRVIQECLQNIIKHAAASHVFLNFNFGPSQFFIEIEDDGKGFDFLHEQKDHHGLGLLNIFKRIEMIGGTATIKSQLTMGTKVKLIIPYE